MSEPDPGVRLLSPEGGAEGPPAESVPVALALSAADFPAEQFLVFKECQDLLQSRLPMPWEKFFAELTGLHLHFWWHQPLDFLEPSAPLVLCPEAREKGNGGEPPVTCRSCLQRCWPNPAQPAREARRFAGQCGLTNLCVIFRADKSFPPSLTLVLQARIDKPASGLASQTGSGPLPCKLCPSVLFDQAVALLRKRVADLKAAVQDWSARRKLEPLGRRRPSLKAANTPPGPAAPPCPPTNPGAASLSPADNRAQQLIQEMTTYLHLHYQQPLSLADVAAAFKMNACYLSSLFSQTLGITFHHYLEELRLAKAQELLRNPTCRIGEVAYAVGYAGPDQFRHVFKARVGVPPSSWRLRGAR